MTRTASHVGHNKRERERAKDADSFREQKRGAASRHSKRFECLPSLLFNCHRRPIGGCLQLAITCFPLSSRIVSKESSHSPRTIRDCFAIVAGSFISSGEKSPERIGVHADNNKLSENGRRLLHRQHSKVRTEPLIRHRTRGPSVSPRLEQRRRGAKLIASRWLLSQRPRTTVVKEKRTKPVLSAFAEATFSCRTRTIFGRALDYKPRGAEKGLVVPASVTTQLVGGGEKFLVEKM